MLEVLELGFFPKPKNPEEIPILAVLYAKVSYRHIFSADKSKTSFYLEPSLGWCRVVIDADVEKLYGDGFAAALEGGYSLEVGQRGNHFIFGLKYENDMASKNAGIQTLSLRVAYSFGFFRKKSF
ncbi:MAG: hypothetical protein C4308_09685 [Chitinophagaceae bacterium]